jgi:hypothetical protein
VLAVPGSNTAGNGGAWCSNFHYSGSSVTYAGGGGGGSVFGFNSGT